ncbi:hypothetical protein BDW22DRAFT_1351723 [Trametopsis cervina]|nr:hypothetical protein BDW22DRAFT_1351723 [Trametopsis cervina]
MQLCEIGRLPHLPPLRLHCSLIAILAYAANLCQIRGHTLPYALFFTQILHGRLGPSRAEVSPARVTGLTNGFQRLGRMSSTGGSRS